MTKKTKSIIEAEWARQQAIMAEAEVAWRERWESISCPFKKVIDLNSPSFKAQRERILAPWREARAAMVAIRSKST